MTKIYVVNSSGHNYNMADKYGTPIVLTQGKVNIFGVDRLTEELKELMNGVTEYDYILLSGNIVLNVLACQIMMAKTGRLNILIYNAFEKDYTPRQMRLKQFRGNYNDAGKKEKVASTK